jgi:hypothetical protein
MQPCGLIWSHGLRMMGFFRFQLKFGQALNHWQIGNASKSIQMMIA